MSRRPFRPELFRSPIRLDEGSSGRMRVRHRLHRAGEPLTIVSVRSALLRGIRPVRVRLDETLVIHELSEDRRGVWMSDCPEELCDIAEALHTFDPRGRVLVGGLGLGVLAKSLAMRGAVESVHVVERSPDVIRLCASPGYTVTCSDLYEYLRTVDRPFDCWMLDTWQGTGEGDWWEYVMPARRIIANRFGRQRVWCWAEDRMAAQVARSCVSQAGMCWHYAALPLGMDEAAAARFVRTVGLPRWEREFGARVDALQATLRERDDQARAVGDRS